MDYSAFFELSLDLLAVASTDGYLRHVNQAWEKALGWTPAELSAAPYLDFVHPDDRAATVEEAGKLATGWRSAQFENRYRRKNGGYLWLQWNAVVWPDDGLVYCIARDVTRAKRLEMNLKEVEESSQVGAWEIDLETSELYWSAATHRIHETDPASYRPKLTDGLAFYPPEAVPMLEEAVGALMRAGTPYRLELPFITARGRHIWVRAMANAQMGADRPIRVFGTLADITEEREERQRLIAFRDIVELASDGICVTDASGYATYANDRMARMLGHSVEGILGRSFISFIAEDWRNDMAGGAGLLGGTDRRDFQMRRADGGTIWVSASLRTRVEAAGVTLSHIVLVRDISERKLIEMELQSNRARLEAAQAIARLGHWEANLGTGELYWSDVIYEIFGFDKAEVRPSIELFNSTLHPDDVALVRASEVRAEETGVHDVQHRIIRPDGQIRWVHELARTSRTETGEIRLIGTVQDITAHKNAEAELVVARAQAESASRAKSTFLATMSHELRTPLNAILGFSEIIRDGIFGPVTPPIYREYAGHVHESASHLLEIINDVLDLAKIEAEAFTLNLERLSLTDKVHRAVQTIRLEAERRGMTLRTEVAGGIFLLADRRATLQALFNILSNAVRHGAKGGTITITAYHRDGFAEIIIEDDGPGFPAEVLAELGQPYPGITDSYRTSPRSTGLGYAITAALMKIQDGTIEAVNRPERGAKVTLRLPVAGA